MARIPFSAQEKTLIRQAAHAVWRMIAHDCFAALAASGEAKQTMTRDEVVELVLDADRTWKEVKARHPELAARMQRADPHQIERIVRDGFEHEEYE